MERMQSTYENAVDYNLSESGVHPLALRELVEETAARDAVMATTLRYTQTNGTVPLRESIAALYAGATPDHIQVTNGGSEANYIAMWNLVEPGDEIVMMVPNYMQISGVARAFGATVREWPLAHDGARWRVDVAALERLVTPRTRLIAICNPNNPTGARFEAIDLDRIAAIAARRGSWLLADEIYCGAERDGHQTPTVWGRYDRAIVTAGLSKAYGLPGLRIGWVVGPPPLVASLWAYHDYTSIAPGALNDVLACHALAPERRARLLARTRQIVNANFPIIAAWLDAHGGLFTYTPPDAGAIVYVRYHHDINSSELVTRLRETHSVMVVPGDHFGMDHHLRIGFGDAQDYLRAALTRLDEGIADCGLRIADSRAAIKQRSPGDPQSAINPQTTIRNPQ
jgi:aspartate/methionine/tyrosine aminotransferase